MTRQPTTDLYFVNAMAPWIARWWQMGRARAPIRRRGENSFIMGDWFVLVRRDTPYIMREALAWSGHLAYVIDDDVAAGMACESLPAPYRARLADFDKRFHRDLLARADKVLAASTLVEALTASEQAARRLGPRLARIDPVWRRPQPTPPITLAEGATLRMVQLGTGSHRARWPLACPRCWIFWRGTATPASPISRRARGRKAGKAPAGAPSGTDDMARIPALDGAAAFSSGALSAGANSL
jgi:hypothetical protein